MSWSAKPNRVFRAAANTVEEDDDVFVVGSSARAELPTAAPIATARDVVAAGHERAARVLAAAEEQAAAIVAGADHVANEARSAGYSDGYEAGQAEALTEFGAHLALVRAAAEEGKALRDSLAGRHVAVVARAAAIAARRIVGDHYAFDPDMTLAICREALRAASGQEVLAIRVNPSVAGPVQASLQDAADYVRPDDSVEVGGCVIDLRHGTLDASLDARLTLMEAALRAAGGDGQ